MDTFEYKWQPLENTGVKSEEEKNPDAISDGGPLPQSVPECTVL